MEMDATAAASVLWTFLTLVGGYALAVWSYETFNSAVGICWGLWKQCKGGDDFVKRYGQWAIITGGSDGIGRQYALYLAKKGLNIMLVAMADEKLKATAREIESQFPVKVKQVPVNFARGFEVYDYIKKEIAGLDIGVLINNVGTGPKFAANFDSFPLEHHHQLINVNVISGVVLSHIALPGMKQRRRGLVVNVASVFGLTAVPTVLMYGATKAFVYSFSEALREELKPFGVECQTVTPHFVATTLTDTFSRSTLGRVICVKVENYGRFLTMTLGKTPQTTGYWAHAILVTLQKLVPIDIMPKIYHTLGGSVWSEQKLKSG